MNRSILQPEVFRDPPQRMPEAPPATMAFLWSRTNLLGQVWQVVRAVREWPGVTIGPDCSGLCFGLGDVLLGHLHWNGRLDMSFGPAVRDRLIAEDLAAPDPDHPASERLVFDVRTLADADRAIWLLRLAYISLDSQRRVCLTGVVQPVRGRIELPRMQS